MTNLVPLSKAQMKKLGIVATKEGIMIDKTRLVEIKKFERKAGDDPQADQVVTKVNMKDMIKETINKNDEAIGIF